MASLQHAQIHWDACTSAPIVPSPVYLCACVCVPVDLGMLETRHFTIQAKNKEFRSKRLKFRSTKKLGPLSLGEWRAYNLL